MCVVVCHRLIAALNQLGLIRSSASSWRQRVELEKQAAASVLSGNQRNCSFYHGQLQEPGVEFSSSFAAATGRFREQDLERRVEREGSRAVVREREREREDDRENGSLGALNEAQLFRKLGFRCTQKNECLQFRRLYCENRCQPQLFVTHS